MNLISSIVIALQQSLGSQQGECWLSPNGSNWYWWMCMCSAWVDFQKGEWWVTGMHNMSAGSDCKQQMNMDYSLAHMLHYNMDHIQWVVTFYDVNCQYTKHLYQQLKDNSFISLSLNIQLVVAIGAWHIHGHWQECLAWYGSNFIPGASQVDGEIMETLWASHNVISLSAWGMLCGLRNQISSSAHLGVVWRHVEVLVS